MHAHAWAISCAQSDREELHVEGWAEAAQVPDGLLPLPLVFDAFCVLDGPNPPPIPIKLFMACSLFLPGPARQTSD